MRHGIGRRCSATGEGSSPKSPQPDSCVDHHASEPAVGLCLGNVCIRQATFRKFALGLRALVAMRMHVVCVRTCLQTSSVVTDNCNSMFCRAARSQEVLCVPLQSPKSQRRGSRSLSCYVCMRGAARERAEPPPKHPKG